MTEKNDNKKKKNDFLETKMYYYNTDPLTERDQILNSKNSKIADNAQKNAGVITINKPRAKKALSTPAKRRKITKSPIPKKVLDRLNSLEDMYKHLVDTLNLSKVSLEIEAIQTNNQQFEDQISQLEQERLSLLEQITSLEAQTAFFMEMEAEKNELKQQVKVFTTEKKDLETKVEQLSKEMNNFSETVSILENKKSIVYLSKEREALENRIAVITQEKRELYLHIQKLSLKNDESSKKLVILEEKVKAIAYLDKKSAMFEEDLKESQRKKHSLAERVTDFEKTNERLTKENKELKQDQEYLQKRVKNQRELQEKMDTLDIVASSLTDKNKQLNAENQELMKQLIAMEKNKKVDTQKQRLLDRVDEMEEERLHLFKIIGEMEEEKKCVPDLVEKNDKMLEENEEWKMKYVNSEKQLTEFIKNTKIMEKEIAKLKEKRGSRLELEQEKGKLQKRNKELEQQYAKLANDSIVLNSKVYESKNKGVGLEHLRKEIIGLESARNELLVQSKKDKANILKLSESILAEKDSENINQDKITELSNENKKFAQELKIIKTNTTVNYVLDLEKLADLKDFVLESIQTRRWKSTEFVNGAYDAVGLFYRTILQERPIKTNK